MNAEAVADRDIGLARSLDLMRGGGDVDLDLGEELVESRMSRGHSHLTAKLGSAPTTIASAARTSCIARMVCAGARQAPGSG